jgi:hypothetical protein
MIQKVIEPLFVAGLAYGIFYGISVIGHKAFGNKHRKKKQ